MRLLVVVLCCWLSTNCLGQPASAEIGVMSFNIRYGSAKDGDNQWDRRRHLVAQVIKDYEPAIVGTQETLPFQAEYLQQQLADYVYQGRSREDRANGEQCGIFYLRKRFVKLIEGHFWLSETPDKPGSKSWDSSLPRMATWLKLWDRKTEASLYVINTHFDHRGKIARQKSAELIRDFVKQLPDSTRVVVTGDFNAGEGSLPYRVFFDVAGGSRLRDTFRVRFPVRQDKEGTFGGFRGTLTGARIDWIAVNEGFEVLTAEIVSKSYQGKYPSDHFPVVAQLRLRTDP